MIPVNLKLSNFTSYGTDVPELDFTKFHLAAISGTNGAGKSSLLDSMVWCVWGTSRLGDSSDPLVRLGQSAMSVEFSFELDKNIFTIKRGRVLKSGGSTSLEFFSGTSAKGKTLHNLTEGTIKATQQKIIDTLHLTYETFVNSAFIRQGHADEFTTKGPSDRKRILADILGLTHYDLLEEKAKEKARDAQTKLQLLEYQLIEIEAELSQKENQEEKKVEAEKAISQVEILITGLEENLKTLRNEKEILSITNEQRIKIEKNYQDSKLELNELKLQGISRKERIDKLEAEIKSLEGIAGQLEDQKKLQQEKEDLEKARGEQLELEKQLSDIKGSLNLKNQTKTQLQKEIDEINIKLESLNKEGAKCPTCNQELNKDHKETTKKQLELEKSRLLEELAKINTTEEEKSLTEQEVLLKSLSFDQTKYINLQSELLKLEGIQRQKEELIQKQATLESEKKVVLELRELYQNKAAQVKLLEEEVSKLPDLSDKLSQVAQEIGNKETEINLKRNEEKDARNTLGQITALISKTEQLEKNQIIKQGEKKKFSEERAIYDELALAFGKKGIQTMIIETAIPEIEEEANKLLDKLSDGRMQVRFETQRETKTKVAGGEKGVVETLDLIISDEMGERPYEAYSGGEQFRVNLSVRLALSKLLTHRAGSKLQFLVIDEGFGTQDAQGKTRIVEALNAIKDDFEKILVITHLEELKEEFPTRIEVQKGSSGSTFQVIGA